MEYKLYMLQAYENHTGTVFTEFQLEWYYPNYKWKARPEVF